MQPMKPLQMGTQMQAVPMQMRMNATELTSSEKRLCSQYWAKVKQGDRFSSQCSDRLSSESRYPNKNLSLTIARFNRFPQRQRDHLINYLLHTCCIHPVGKFERRAKQEPSVHLPRHTCTSVAVFQS